MRKEFVECETEEQAYEACPWAGWAAEVVGGYWMFESITDYEIFMNQE